MKWQSRNVELEQVSTNSHWQWCSDGKYLSVIFIDEDTEFVASSVAHAILKQGIGATAEEAMRACDAACEREALALAPWLVKP